MGRQPGRRYRAIRKRKSGCLRTFQHTDKRGEAPFSVDANLLHASAEGKVLEDRWAEPEEFVFSRTQAPETAPDMPEYVEIAFERGDPVALDGRKLSPVVLLRRLNELGGRHGIGRLDLVEN